MHRKRFTIVSVLICATMVASAQPSTDKGIATDTDLSDLLLKVFTILSAVGALVSGYYAYIAGRLSKVGLAYNFFMRYSDDKMVASLRLIGEMRRQHNKNLVSVWLDAKNRKDEWADKVEDARHTIKYFYRDVATLYQSKCMNYNMAKKICSAGGIHLFMTTILEMDGKINAHKIEKEFHPIGKIYRHFIRLEERKREHDLAARFLRSAKVKAIDYKVFRYFAVQIFVRKIKQSKRKM